MPIIPPSPALWELQIYFLSLFRFLNLLSIYLPILDILYKQNHTMAFCVWLPLLDTMFWRFIYIVVSISTSFCSQIRFHYMNISFIHSLVDEHLNYLPFWIILNDMNTGVQITLQDVINSGDIRRSRIAGPSITLW